MRTPIVLVLMGIAFGLGVGAGMLGLLWATGGIAEPSRDVGGVAPTLALDAPPPTAAADLSAQITELGGRIDGLATQIAGLNLPAPETPAPPQATAEPEPDAAAAAPERALFRIITDESEARFLIEEILLGNPTTVVGITPNVAGDVIVNFADPAASQVGVIAINARTLRTDQQFRDQSIRGQILQSSRAEYEFITFAPTRLDGLPAGPVSVGATLDFEMTGDLTIRDVTQPVTFNVTVTVDDAERISGLASAEILYADWGIVVNAPPQVGGVADEVILEIEFAAIKVYEE